VNASLMAGLAAGLGSVAISEALLVWWSRRPRIPALQVVFAGMALRTVWMAAALAAGLGYGFREPRAYIAALMAAYLFAQVWEGFRYRRFVDNR